MSQIFKQNQKELEKRARALSVAEKFVSEIGWLLPKLTIEADGSRNYIDFWSNSSHLFMDGSVYHNEHNNQLEVEVALVTTSPTVWCKSLSHLLIELVKIKMMKRSCDNYEKTIRNH